MKRIQFFCLLVAASLTLAGCTAILPLSSMVNEGYIANPQNYEIIGDVEGQSTVSCLFGFIPLSTDAGYLAAYQDALQSARDRGADGLIEIYSDMKHFTFLGLYSSRTTIVYATAIKKKT